MICKVLIFSFCLTFGTLNAQKDSCFIENYKKDPEHADMFGFDDNTTFIYELGRLVKSDKAKLSKDLEGDVYIKVFLNKSLTMIDSIEVEGLRLSPKKQKCLLRRSRKKVKIIRTCWAINYYATGPKPLPVYIRVKKRHILFAINRL